jgi:predicted ribosomally synthesized peptide with nif11-like leader
VISSRYATNKLIRQAKAKEKKTMKNLTPELIAKAKEAKSAEELLEIAKANGVELTAEEAKTYFEQLSANSAVSDDDLDAIAGGSEDGCGNDDEEEDKKPPYTTVPKGKCAECGGPVTRMDHKCPWCDAKFRPF